MVDINIGNFTISNNHAKITDKTFIIAEIGQNHQGDVEIAKTLIKTAKNCGAHCVKFQKTCLTEKFNKKALMRPYQNHNSWGNTYGEHKKYLEFSEEEFKMLQAYSKEIGILFSASAMDLVSLQFLIAMDLPFIKIGSGDANNIILIEQAAKCGKPLIISTGMHDFSVIRVIYETVMKYHNRLILMHCVSGYPTPLDDINLNVILSYRRIFPNIHIGYSGHEIGAETTPAAIALGAKVIERHLTLDHNLKGSDHKCSLDPQQFAKMVNTIWLIERALGNPIKQITLSELPCKEKLGKTLVASRNITAGHVLTSTDLKIKVAQPRGLDGARYRECVGKILLRDIREDDPLTNKHLVSE